MKKNQQGFTLIEVIIVIIFVVTIVVGVGILVVGGHFISKFW